MRHFTPTAVIDSFLARLGNNKISFLTHDTRSRQKVQSALCKLRATFRSKHLKDGEGVRLDLAKELWWLLMSSSLRSIAVTNNVRGLGELHSYYLKSVTFEDVLFGIEPTYRDHTMHALWVYLLGEYIQTTHRGFRGMTMDWALQCSGTVGAKHFTTAIGNALELYRDPVFAIVALCHDLAYPFERAEKLNARVKDLVRFIGVTTVADLRYEISTEQSHLIAKLLELMSLRPTIVSEGAVLIATHEPTFVDLSQSLEHRKHGVLSAYLLYRLLDTMGEVAYSDIPHGAATVDRVRDLMIRKTILVTIASHSCDYALSLAFNSHRFLLSLVDELEEFSRFTRLSRGLGADEICKSGMSVIRKGEFAVEYKFTRQHKADPKQFFRSRAIRFCRMIEAGIDGPNSIRAFSMSCVDWKERSHREYRLEIKPNGVRLRMPGAPWRRLDPDPETQINEFIPLGKG